MPSVCNALVQKCGISSHSFSIIKHSICRSEKNLNVVMFRLVYK